MTPRREAGEEERGEGVRLRHPPREREERRGEEPGERSDGDVLREAHDGVPYEAAENRGPRHEEVEEGYDAEGRRDALAALEAEPDRVVVAEDGADSREREKRVLLDEARGREHGEAALEHIEDGDRDGPLLSHEAADVRRAYVARAVGAYVRAADVFRDEEACRARTCEITEERA